MNARAADMAAIGIASLAAHWTPIRFTPVNSSTMPQAITGTGMPGKYHSWIAAEESRAVSPQVGTQPHQ